MADATRAEVAAKRGAWYVRAWRAFNRWRRKYWLARVVILLVIFAEPISERLGHFAMYPRLLGMAINAIQRSAPTMEYHYYRFYKAREAERPRYLLLRELHTDADGRLAPAERQRAEALGLNVSQLEEPPPVPDLAPLAHAAKVLGLVPATYSVQGARDEAFYAARARSEEIEARHHQEVQAILDQYYTWPDYGKWGTWKEGLANFLGWILSVAVNLGVGSWLLLCFLGALGVSAQFRRRRLAGFVASLGVSAGLWLVYSGIPDSWAVGPAALALLCSSGAVGLWAGGLAKGIRRPRLAASACTAASGATLVLSGLLVGQSAKGYLWMVGQLPSSQWWEGNTFWPSVDPVRIIVGLLLIIAAGYIAAFGLGAAAASPRGARRD